MAKIFAVLVCCAAALLCGVVQAQSYAILYAGGSEHTLTLHHHNDGDWEDLQILGRDVIANTLSVRVTSFSPFFLGGGGSEPIPEPATMSLLALGSAAALRRRRRVRL